MNSTFRKWGWNDFLRIGPTVCERLVRVFYSNATIEREATLSEKIIAIKSYVMRKDLFISPDMIPYALPSTLQEEITMKSLLDYMFDALCNHVDLQFTELHKLVDSQFAEIRKEMTSFHEEFSTRKTDD
ncbi:hypothetical protein V6N12_057313 [Hibiscus sabdariffa]|uniref:Uncharacterized protein n=1 Tax=Hibiscus sabdariffa TaxID=183260 RepID=A0ABR2DBU6_9ROSI